MWVLLPCFCSFERSQTFCTIWPLRSVAPTEHVLSLYRYEWKHIYVKVVVKINFLRLGLLLSHKSADYCWWFVINHAVARRCPLSGRDASPTCRLLVTLLQTLSRAQVWFSAISFFHRGLAKRRSFVRSSLSVQLHSLPLFQEKGLSCDRCDGCCWLYTSFKSETSGAKWI